MDLLRSLGFDVVDVCFLASRSQLTNNCAVSRTIVLERGRRLVFLSSRCSVSYLRGTVLQVMDKRAIVRILTCLICLFVVGAALDSLPDPPAVKLPSSQKYSISRITHRPVAADAKLNSDWRSCGLPLHTNFIPTTQVFESASLPAKPLVFHAADTSPPRPS